ncbi:MAG: tetratricopeptide repeat protein [Flavipsychrobacter sp.]|nr:tetratricopeptide repeat protein [Flavipsychrobacter sp.]
MANTTRNKPGQEEVTITPEGAEVLDNIQVSYEKNKKRINTAIIVVVVAVGGFLGYKNFYQAPREEKASAQMYFPQKYLAADSLDKALNGDGQHKGFLNVIKKYSGTDAANLANYYAGVCYLRKGDSKNAIKYLGEFNGKGTLVEYSAMGALGDAYMNEGKTDKAVDYYVKAAGKKDDAVHAPIYLFRAGLAYEKLNKPEEAKKMYQKIRAEYPMTQEGQKVDKQLAQLGDLGE